METLIDLAVFVGFFMLSKWLYAVVGGVLWLFNKRLF
jgi:hypothetical protein